MFDIAWSEMLVIAVVALVVIGPKDLPKMIREVGRWTAKARGMAREFQRSFDDMIREAELDDIRKGLEATRPANVIQKIRETVDPEGDLDRAFDLEDDRARATAAIERKDPSPSAPAPAAAAAEPPQAPATRPAEPASAETTRP
jgi:sec-independent protein translocase protein TatB